MKYAVDFHDSFIGHVDGSGSNLSLYFSRAYIHEATARPGLEPGLCHLQPITLAFEAATWDIAPPPEWRELYDAEISIDGKQMSLLPIPFELAGSVEAEFHFGSGDGVLKVTASVIRCATAGDVIFSERFPGTV